MASAADWIERLADPACYPDQPAHVEPPRIEVLQTHISVVCLAGDRVYKLKKAVTLPFLDFGSVERRLHFCREEVRLNRRLCPDTYLGVVALCETPAGLRFLPTAEGTVIDHAVLMRRLPADRMLDELLREQTVDARDLEALARTVAAFHARAERGPEVNAAGAPENLHQLARANFTELRAQTGHGLPEDLLAALERRSEADFVRILPRLRRRAGEGRIVDGHGDLHARNICLTAPPAIYDCIEFDAGFRCGDVATENAFLVMDLRHRGAPDLARDYLRAYVAASGDTEQPSLMPTLVAYRAMVRAKVATLAAADAGLSSADREGACRSALQHVQLAAAATIEARGPLWVLLCGPPASGKSSLAAELHARSGWPVLATDRVRKELAGIEPHATARPEHYTAAFGERTYDELLRRAARATAAGAPVVLLDGNFPTPDHRTTAQRAAKAAGCRLSCVHVSIDATTALARSAARARAGGSISDADPAVTTRLHAAFVPPSADEGFPVVAVDGTRPTAAAASEALAGLLAAPAD